VPRRVLITGITGFSGSHLAEHLVARGDEVHGLAHEEPPYPFLAAVARGVAIHRGDLTRLDDVRAALRVARPDVVVHLAGQAVPTLASRDPLGAVSVNVMGTATLIVALAEHPGTRVVAASSAHVYGTPERSLVSEDARTHPENVYAATKLAAEALMRELGERGTSEVTILRPANQLGPRQHPALAASAFARQIAAAEAGQAEPVVRHGGLDAERDFIDVRDMARAYGAAIDLQGSDTYNVGSGRAVAIATILEKLIALARIPIRAEHDPSRGVGDRTRVALDATRFRRRTGWSPRIGLDESLRDTLDFWRAQIRDFAGAGGQSTPTVA
jgi:GDP-4-dehydro-6-deoxy-D-mannose reductase